MRELSPLRSWSAAGGAVRAMDFFRHETGVRLAVADNGGSVRLFDPETGMPFTAADGTEVVVTTPRSAPVHDLRHSRRPSGWPTLATVGGDGTTRAYDISTGSLCLERSLGTKEELRVIETFQEPDGSAMVAVAGKGDTVYLWRGDASTPERLTGHTGPIRALQALRVEERLAVADEHGVAVWRVASPEPERVAFCVGRSRSLAVLRELGRVRLVTAAPDGIHLWDPDTGEELAHFAHQVNAAAVVAFEAEDDEQLLAVASGSTVTLWSPATESRARTQLAGVPRGAVQVLARILTGNGTLLAAADDKGTVTVWRLLPKRRAANLVGTHDDWVNDLAVVGAPRRPLLVSASDDRFVTLWNLSTGRSDRREHGTQVQEIAPIGDEVASGDQDGWVRVWSTQDGVRAPRWAQRTQYGAVRAMTSFRSTEGWRIVSAGGAGHCILWDAASGAVLRQLRSPAADQAGDPEDPPVRAVAAAELNGRWYVAAGDFGGRIEVWDAETGDVHWALRQAHPTQIRSLAVLHTGGRVRLASGGSTGMIRLWDLADGRLVGESAVGHSGAVAALCAVGGGQAHLLASGGADRAIRLWDPEEIDAPISEIVNAHDSWVRALTQLSNGDLTQLASGGEEGAIRLWQVRNRQLVRSAHALTIRGFRDRLAQTDVLDRRAIVEELCALLRPDREPPAAYGTTGPQIVMIQGAWGTGKSSVMHDLRTALDDGPRTDAAPADSRELTPRQVSRLMKDGPPTGRTEPQPMRETVTAWFNPWAHESSEQVWSGLAWSIIDATRSRLGDTVAERQRYWLIRNLPRLDRAAVRRTIRQRIWRPTVAALAGLVFPLGVTFVRMDSLDKGVLDWLAIGLAIVITLLVAVLGAGGLYQYLRGKATAYLPADIFDGPVDQAPFVTTTGERLLRDLPYVSAAGQLYRVNEDVHRIATDLRDRGCQLVVFIDDLDRCSRRSTADVFEAINSFLSDRHFPDSAPRFVIGLDATVVAGRLAEGQVAAQSQPDPDDPGPGWGILRKLSQLTVVLPGIRSAHTTRLLRQHTPRREERVVVPAPQASPRAPSKAPEKAAAPPAAAHDTNTGPPSRTAVVLPLEGEPRVHEHLRRLIMLRPRQTMRETKRLLTLWAFYMRLLDRVLPPGRMANVQDACDALTLAEVVRRWPALVPALARTSDGPSGLHTLIEAVAADRDSRWARNWHAALGRLGLARPEWGTATANLHGLLREHGNAQVARFADRLL